MKVRIQALVLSFAGALTACSTTATITRVSGPPAEAEIVGGTPDSIVVEDENGTRSTIPRTDIRDVDHPGNVHAAVGTGVFGYGLLNIAVGLPKCNQQRQDDKAAYCTGVFLPALIGAGMMLWGFATHSASVDSLSDRSMRLPIPPPPDPRPQYSPPRAPRYGAPPAPVFLPPGPGFSPPPAPATETEETTAAPPAPPSPPSVPPPPAPTAPAAAPP